MATTTSSANVTGTSSSPSGTPTTQGTSTLFSPGASPPLILAFLAIGLFTISMAAVFGWRRIQLGRGVLPPLYGGDEIEFGERARRGHGEKPKLWDLWTDMRVPGRERDISWDTIMPVAVMDIPDPPMTHVPRPSSAHNGSARYRLWSLRPVRVESDVKAEPVPPSYTRLQVAVAIAMPSPHSHEYHMDNEHQPVEKAQVDYMIGLYHYAGQGRGEG
ncbi:hypothetical protein BDZ94DRAFT_1311893 [Collybia nuda]|uniref:Uncharacterized protein n=1 Tax=Collybia nuda TaxID=64659 RepID=A0A9P5Y0F2_9AGAR|nr:hypothetical protein BDZ94DRAFT_1311893 [Collybia nuda]